MKKAPRSTWIEGSSCRFCHRPVAKGIPTCGSCWPWGKRSPWSMPPLERSFLSAMGLRQ